MSFHDIADIWLFEYDGKAQLEKAETDEVADCRWMSADDIKELYENKKLFTPWIIFSARSITTRLITATL